MTVRIEVEGHVGLESKVTVTVVSEPEDGEEILNALDAAYAQARKLAVARATTSAP